MKNILVVGSGGREHAIIHTIKRFNPNVHIFCITGNAGIADIAEVISNISQDDNKAIINFCKEKNIDFVIIGPEAPLVNGIVDELKIAGIRVFGPTKMASSLEGSKAFTKKICDDYNIPTAKYSHFDNKSDAIKFIENMPEGMVVVKADGLAAGKGVIVAQSKKEAILATEEIFGGKFGAAGASVVIEEYLDGDEISFFAICDGEHAIFIGTAEDHKRAYDNDMGPNTGGMGTFSPSNYESPELITGIMKNFIEPTLQGMKEKGYPFVGILFAGLMITKEGPKLIEFNTRFGDPETESILPRLETNLLELMMKAEEGNIKGEKVSFSNKKAVTVIIAGRDYPEKSSKDSHISNLPNIKLSSDSIIFHAGTKKQDDKILSNGGRVLALCSVGNSLDEARSRTYKIAEEINWTDGYYRKDIGIKKPRFL